MAFSIFDPSSYKQLATEAGGILSRIKGSVTQPNPTGVLDKIRSEVRPIPQIQSKPVALPTEPTLDFSNLPPGTRVDKKGRPIDSYGGAFNKGGEGVSKPKFTDFSPNPFNDPTLERLSTNWVKDYNSTPLASYARTVKNTAVSNVQSIKDRASSFKKDPSLWKGLGVGIEATHLAFAPVSAAFEEAQKIPVAGPVIKGILETISEGATNWTEYAFQPNKNDTPFFVDMKQNFLKPLALDTIQLLAFDGLTKMSKVAKTSATTKPFDFTPEQLEHVKAEAKVNVLEQEANKPIGPKSSMEELARQEDANAQLPLAREELANARASNQNPLTTKQKTAVFDWYRKVETALKTSNPLTALERLGIIKEGEIVNGSVEIRKTVRVPREPVKAAIDLWDKVFGSKPLPFIENLIESAHPKDLAIVTKTLQATWDHIRNRGGIQDAGIGLKAKETPGTFGEKGMEKNAQMDLFNAQKPAEVKPETAIPLTNPIESGKIESANPPSNVASTPGQIPAGGAAPEERPGAVQASPQKPVGGEGGIGGADLGTDGNGLRNGGQLETNAKALEIIKKPIEQITPAEKEVLRSYEGVGGQEKAGAEGRGLLDQYYTPKEVVNEMWAIAEKYGFKEGGKVLEPSMGTGRFIENGPKATYLGFDTDPNAVSIAKVLLDGKDAILQNKQFEELFVDRNGEKTKAKYNLDLVIGNPPYGKHRGYFQSLDEPRITSYEDYFLKRGLDVLRPGGTLVMLVPSSFLKTKVDTAKGLIAEQGKLVNAYRLPEGTFKTTGIGTDILVFTKRPLEGSGETLSQRIELMSGDNFFKTHPDKIRGETKTRKNRFGKEETYVAKRKGEKLNTTARAESLEAKKPESVQSSKKELPTTDDLNASVKDLMKQFDDGEKITTFQDFAEQTLAVAEDSSDPNAGKIIKAVKDYQNELDLDNEMAGRNDMDTAEETMMNAIKAVVSGKKAAKPEIHEPTKQSGGSFFKSATPYTDSELSMWRAKGPDGSVDVSRTSYPEEKLNRYKGKFFDDFDYLTGNLYEKIDQLKKEDISDEQKSRQEAKLRKALPTPKTIEKINLNPIGQFAQDFKVGDVSLMEDFKNYMNNLPNEAFAPSGRYETIGYIRGDSVRTNKDKVLAMAIKQRRKATAEKLFRKFVTEDLAKDTQKRLVDEFNRSMNGYARPDYTKVPLAVDGLDTDFGGRKLYMQDYKVDSIGFLSHKGLGINANGVGLGKTMMAIISTVQDVQKGWYKRPVFIVPKGVYAKWISEIKALFPNQRVVGLGNLGTKFNVKTAADLKGMIHDGDITVVTHEAIMRFGFKDETIFDLTQDLQNAYDVESAKTKRGEALEAEKRQATAGKARLRSDLHFEELGFDNIIVDEAHNFKNIFERAKSPEKVSKADLRAQGNYGEQKPTFAGRWGGLQGPSSARGVKLWFISQYIQSLNNGRGVKLLTATPFSNNPLEYYNMLSLLAMDEMKAMGVGNINGFMDMFVRSKHTFVVKAGGKFELGEVVEDWQNAEVLRELIGRYIDFKDGEKYGVDRPSKTVKDHRLNPTSTQIDHLQQAQELLDQKHREEGGVLVYIDEAKKITLSPYLSRYSKESIPDAKTFIESSPKLMSIMELIRANQKKTGQLIYYPLAVETMPMVKEYLTSKIGYKPSEVEIIHGQVSDIARERIKSDFNSGIVKVIIGSDAIKEGVDLQERATDLYISSYPWRPTDITQVEGRIWRQGNIYKGVRVHFVSLNDTIDPFLFQKLETKAKRLSSAGSLDQAMDLGDMDWEEAKHELVRDPAAKLNLKKQMATGKIEQELNSKKSEAAIINDTLGKEETLTKEVDRAKRSMDLYSSGYMSEHYKKEFKNAERRLKSFKEKDINEEELKATTDRLKGEIAQLEEDLKTTKEEFDKKSQDIKPLAQLEIKPNDFGSILEKAKAENESFIQTKAPMAQQEVKVLKQKPLTEKGPKELPTYEDKKPDPTIEKVISEIVFEPHMIPLDAPYVTPTGDMMKGYVEMTISEVDRYAKANADKLIKWYKENVSSKNISADDFKLVFPGYDGINSDTYHQGSSYLSKKMIAEYVSEIKPGDTVIFTAGGTGAGKTHGMKSLAEDYKFLIDGNFATDNALATANKVLSKDGKVFINLVIRDVYDAWENGVMPRQEKTGRIVSVMTHMRTHVDSIQKAVQFSETNADNPNVKVAVTLNVSGSDPAEIGIDKAKEVLYTLIANKELVSQKIYEHITQKSQSGKIVPSVLEAILRQSETGQQRPEQGAGGDVARSEGKGEQPTPTHQVKAIAQSEYPDLHKRMGEYSIDLGEANDLYDVISATDPGSQMAIDLGNYATEVERAQRDLFEEVKSESVKDIEAIDKSLAEGGATPEEAAKLVMDVLQKNRFAFTRKGLDLNTWIDRHMASQDWPTFIKEFTGLFEDALEKGKKWPMRPETQKLIDNIKGGTLDSMDMRSVVDLLPESLKKKSHEKAKPQKPAKGAEAPVPKTSAGAQEAPAPGPEVHTGDKVTDDTGMTYTVNATMSEAKAMAVYQEMLDTADPSVKGNQTWIDQMTEQAANPNRYHETVEVENPKGIKIGDRVRITKQPFKDQNGKPFGNQTVEKPFEDFVVSSMERNGRIEFKTITNKNYGGWSDISETDKIGGGLEFDFGDQTFEKEGVKMEDRKPIMEENQYVKRHLAEKPTANWEDRYETHENGVVKNPDVSYAYGDKIVKIKIETAETKDGSFAAELDIHVGTGGRGGPLSQYNTFFPTKKAAIDDCLKEAEEYLSDSMGPNGSQVTENQKANVRKALEIVKTRKIHLDNNMVADELDFRERYAKQDNVWKAEKTAKMGVVETPEAEDQIIDLSKTTKEVVTDEPAKPKKEKKAKKEPVAEEPVAELAPPEPPTPPTEPPSKELATAPEAPLPQAESVIRPARIDLSKTDRFRVIFQDRMLPVKRLQEKAGEIPEDSDIYLAEELYKGRVQDALEKFRSSHEDRIRAEIDNIFKGSDHADRLKALTQDYLVALHAPERNKAHYDGAAGVSTQEANEWRALIESNPEFPKIKEASSLIKELAGSLPAFLLKNELIDQETFDKLSSVYVDYVPLNRIMDDETDFVNIIGIGKGFDIRGKEVKRAFGSKKVVDDIFHNVVANWERAIVRAYKNKVGQTILKFAQRYPDLGIFEIIPGKMASMVKEGEAFFFREAPKSPTVLSVKVEGKQKYIDIKDKDVAAALKNLDAQSSSLLVNLLTPFTRFYSMMNTSLNLEFLVSNFARDIQQSTLNNVADFGLGSALKGTSRIFSAQKGMIDFYRGKDTEWSNLFKEMKAEGGTTAFFNIRSADEITKLLRDGEIAFAESAAGFPVRVGKKMLDGIAMLNDIVENGTRLATYKLAKDRGLSNAKAASVAKNITVNFNRHGTAGPLMNALYAFSNASMQGTFRTFRTMRNPRTAIKLIATIAALTILTNLWNDENSPDEYEKIPMYEREGNWIVMYGDKQYMKIPIPWGFNVFKVATEYAYELSKGKKSAKAGVQATAIALVNAYNPLGSSSMLQSMIPTITRPFYDVSANTSWSGSPIAPMNLAKTKESLNYYDSTNEIFKDAANLMSKASGGKGAKPGMVEVSPEALEYLWNQYTGGVGRMVSKSYVTLSNLGKGEPTPTKDIPFARRLMGETNEESFNKNQMFDILMRATQDVVPEDRPKLLNALKSEIAAGRLEKKDAIAKMKQFDNDQAKLKNVDAEVAYIKKSGMEGEKLDRFITALQDKKFMKSKGKKPFNKTQIKVLKSLL